MGRSEMTLREAELARSYEDELDTLRAENARLKAVTEAQAELVEALEEIEIDTLVALKGQASSPLCMPTVLAAEQIELCRRMYKARANLAALEEQA